MCLRMSSGNSPQTHGGRSLLTSECRSASNIGTWKSAEIAGIASFPALAIVLRLGTNHDVIGPYVGTVQGGTSVVVPPCGMRYSAVVFSRRKAHKRSICVIQQNPSKSNDHGTDQWSI